MDQLNIRCSFSKIRLMLVTLTHLLAFLSLCFSGTHEGLMVLLAVTLLYSECCFIERIMMRHPLSIRYLRGSNGEWAVTLVNGDVKKVVLVGEVVVWSWLVTASFQDNQGVNYPFVLFCDGASSRDHRLSRVYFRFYAHAQAPTS